jgi:hypothetical protein
VILEHAHLRGDVRALSYSSVLYHSFFSFARGFSKIFQVFSQYFSIREPMAIFAFDLQKTCIFFLYMIYYTVFLDNYPYFTIYILQIPEALNDEILRIDPGRYG